MSWLDALYYGICCTIALFCLLYIAYKYEIVAKILLYSLFAIALTGSFAALVYVCSILFRS